MAWTQPVKTVAYLLIVNLLHTFYIIIMNPLYWIFKKLKPKSLSPYFHNKTVLVTGASSGIGEGDR